MEDFNKIKTSVRSYVPRILPYTDGKHTMFSFHTKCNRAVCMVTNVQLYAVPLLTKDIERIFKVRTSGDIWFIAAHNRRYFVKILQILRKLWTNVLIKYPMLILFLENVCGVTDLTLRRCISLACAQSNVSQRYKRNRNG